MEYREIYSKYGEPTGKIVEKHAEKHSGEYFLHTIVILKSDKSPNPGEGEGTYVIQQRSLKSKYLAGEWDVTGGGVRAGETPKETAVRETDEELGLHIDLSKIKECYSYHENWEDGTGLLIHVYACRVHVPEEGIKINEYEVNDAKEVAFHEFYEMLKTNHNEEFMNIIHDVEQRI